jgi:hypothetical protein
LCSPSGVATACNPIAVTGCTAGACYLTTPGTVCVCPAGTQVLGGTCMTTTDCQPGHVCAGTSAPGICRPMCDPAAPKCGANEFCINVTLHPTFGYCVKK